MLFESPSWYIGVICRLTTVSIKVKLLLLASFFSTTYHIFVQHLDISDTEPDTD